MSLVHTKGRRRDRTRATDRPAAFTLVEIMVVVIIIGVLAGLIIPQVVSRIGKSRHGVAVQKLASIENAIQLFYTEYERYPEAIEELTTRPADIDEQQWQPPTLKPKNLIDPWGRPFVYVYPGENWDFDLFSLGKDGQEGGQGENADVVNWQ